MRLSLLVLVALTTVLSLALPPPNSIGDDPGASAGNLVSESHIVAVSQSSSPSARRSATGKPRRRTTESNLSGIPEDDVLYPDGTELSASGNYYVAPTDNERRPFPPPVEYIHRGENSEGNKVLRRLITVVKKRIVQPRGNSNVPVVSNSRDIPEGDPRRASQYHTRP